MSCQVEQIADCGDLSSLGRALFISEKEGIELVFTNHQDCHFGCCYFTLFKFQMKIGFPSVPYLCLHAAVYWQLGIKAVCVY